MLCFKCILVYWNNLKKKNKQRKSEGSSSDKYSTLVSFFSSEVSIHLHEEINSPTCVQAAAVGEYTRRHTSQTPRCFLYGRGHTREPSTRDPRMIHHVPEKGKLCHHLLHLFHSQSSENQWCRVSKKRPKKKPKQNKDVSLKTNTINFGYESWITLPMLLSLCQSLGVNPFSDFRTSHLRFSLTLLSLL